MSNQAMKRVNYNRPKIEQPFREDPVLDILHIAYIDYKRGGFTKIEKLVRIMKRAYPFYNEKYIKKLINITINSHWFNKLNVNEVHLLERGVEFYINMAQNHRAEKWAKDTSYKTNLVIVLTIIGILITVAITYWGK